MHISNLPGDYYHFDIAQQRLVGERSGRSFQLGAPLKVLVAAVKLDERKIDLEPVDLPAPRKQRGKPNEPAGQGRKKRSDGGAKTAPAGKSKRGGAKRRKR